MSELLTRQRGITEEISSDQVVGVIIPEKTDDSHKLNSVIIPLRDIMLPEEDSDHPYTDERIQALKPVLNFQERYNEESRQTQGTDKHQSPVELDPCKITLDMILKECPYSTGDSAVCYKGVVVKDEKAFCPLQPNRQITLRSTFASREE